jgi:hypothetical protein
MPFVPGGSAEPLAGASTIEKAFVALSEIELIVSTAVPVFSMVKYCVAAMTRPKEIARGVTTSLL